MISENQTFLNTCLWYSGEP